MANGSVPAVRVRVRTSPSRPTNSPGRASSRRGRPRRTCGRAACSPSMSVWLVFSISSLILFFLLLDEIHRIVAAFLIHFVFAAGEFTNADGIAFLKPLLPARIVIIPDMGAVGRRFGFLLAQPHFGSAA